MANSHKTKFFGNNNQVIEAFLKRTLPTGSNNQATISYRDGRIYSYAECIGELKESPLDVILDLVEPKRTSHTTKCHISKLTYLAKRHGLLK